MCFVSINILKYLSLFVYTFGVTSIVTLHIEKILRTTNIDRLECIYPLFNKKDTDFMINLCQKYQKFMSGGSDYHTKNKPNISMGTGINNNILLQKTFVKDWINKVRKI